MYVCLCLYIYNVYQGCTNPDCQVVWEANFLQGSLIAYFLAFSMELALFHLSGAWNFDVAATFLYSMRTLGARGGAVG
jgi:hypothetical protein